MATAWQCRSHARKGHWRRRTIQELRADARMQDALKMWFTETDPAFACGSGDEPNGKEGTFIRFGVGASAANHFLTAGPDEIRRYRGGSDKLSVGQKQVLHPRSTAS